ncbi:MAG: aldolase/citrate lyase family protein [Candidatus Latescibacterota bacterium]|nr:aldolase/citrate lyase family protein [Candidatus Latescibacterota bacterium]
MRNTIRESLAAGQPSVGSWLNLASPLSAEVMASCGFPWLCIDAEHASFDLGLITHTLRAIEARSAFPLVRTWDHDPVTVGRLLDAGARGLVFPHVSTPEQAQSLTQAMRYPPVGSRSMGTGRCVTLAGNYREIANDDVLCIPQIEDVEGIENAEAICSVEGVDIGFLGPSDLALAMGLKAGGPQHEEAVQAFREGCIRAGKPCGIPAADPASAKQRIAEGFLFIDLANDLRFLQGAATQALAQVG